MSLQGETTTDARLNFFFGAASEEQALDGFHLLWESTLVEKVRPYLQSQQIHADARSEIETETYLRVCNSLLHWRAKADEAPTPTQQATSPKAPITDIQGYAMAAARGLLYNYFLAQNPAWRRLQLRVISHLKQGDRVTRWKQEFRWLAGLTAWAGTPFRAKSARAQAFLSEDYAAFRQGGLQNQEPGEIELADLMCRILLWIDSPLWQNRLTGHLLKLYRQEASLPLSWEEISADGERQDESLWNEGMEVFVATKQTLREALCQDGLLSRQQRGVILLKLDIATLTGGLGLTLSQAAKSLEIDVDALFGADGDLLLPMPDNRIATLLDIDATKTITATERVSTYYRMTARRKLEHWLQNSG